MGAALEMRLTCVRACCLQRGAGLHPKMRAVLGPSAPQHDLTELPGVQTRSLPCRLLLREVLLNLCRPLPPK